LTPIKVSYTEEAMTFIDAIKAECQSRWWIQQALDEFLNDEAREAANLALNRSIRLDQALERNLEAALATHGGVRRHERGRRNTGSRRGRAHHRPRHR